MSYQENIVKDQKIPAHDRRAVLKKLLAGAGVMAGCSALPERWISPIVGQFVLPAHAQTSGSVIVEIGELEVADSIEDLVSTTAEAASTSTEEYNTTETYTLRSTSGNNKKYTWLNQTGSYYGGQIKFDFGGCGELVVPNSSVSHGADGTTSNHNQSIYFCGTDFEPGTAENNNYKASVFTPPNCTASTVTLYYNK